jgi:hypothetical protein
VKFLAHTHTHTLRTHIRTVQFISPLTSALHGNQRAASRPRGFTLCKKKAAERRLGVLTAGLNVIENLEISNPNGN